LSDRWGWDLQAPRIHYDAIRFGQPVTVLAIDLDHFKHVNDRYGHVAGDAVLQAASTMLRQVAESADLIARYGGDEFLVLAPGVDLGAATALATRLCDSLATTPVTIRVTSTSSTIIRDTTASIGVAVQPPDNNSSLHDLVLDADTALRRAKRSGRSQVCTAEVAGHSSSTPFSIR